MFEVAAVQRGTLLWPHFIEKSMLIMLFVQVQGIYKIGNITGYILNPDAISAPLDQLMKRVHARAKIYT